MEKGFVKKLWKIPTDAQRQLLHADGLKDRDIYEDAGKDENIDACIMAFRGRGGVIKIAADFRVFGDSQEAITAVVDRCEQQGIKLVDVAHPELKSVSAQIKHAFARLAFMRRFDGDKRKARKTGEAGGRAKAVVAAAKRAERVPDLTISRLIWTVENKQVVTWRHLEWILGGKPFSVATIRRHYVSSGPPPPEKRRKADEE